MNIIKRIGCIFGRHRRWKGRAKLIGYTYYAPCIYCGVGMRQIGNKIWVVDRAKAVRHQPVGKPK